jgi:cell wall-associated NlpC family hydrolase
LLDITVPDITDLINIPFSSDGRDPKVSLSCWGLVMEVQRRFGNIIPDYKIPAEASSQIAAAFALDVSQWERLETPEVGCVIALAIDSNYPGYVQHFGVCLGDRFIHTLMKTNSHTVPMDHRFYARKIKGFYRWIK